VGPETWDDAAVLRVSAELALCFTADVITPVVDEPEDWGWIAAANALSDVYAMGGTPLAALNLVFWPKTLGAEILRQVLSGGAEAARAAGCILAGGHSVEDQQPKYGLAVIGTVAPDRILRNRGAAPGDRLYLSKPLGTGVLATAIKAGLASPEEIAAATAGMKQLNRSAAEAAAAAPARALTDVTGFGLAGHLCGMLGDDGRLGAELQADALPLLPGALRHVAGGMIPAGAYRNREAYAERVELAPGVPEGIDMVIYDPQTSGGLLAALPPELADAFAAQAAARGATVCHVGQVTDSGRIRLVA